MQCAHQQNDACVYVHTYMQELNETVGGKLEEYIHAINGCYPPEIVEYYSPNYSKVLLDKIDEFQPMVA